ncbi:MAG TPA: ATP-binding protein [Anaeromyxobacteraceae bacterium]|nr:ATP-binding protein [Anaeromyxobacteraceae bacterium]
MTDAPQATPPLAGPPEEPPPSALPPVLLLLFAAGAALALLLLEGLEPVTLLAAAVMLGLGALSGRQWWLSQAAARERRRAVTAAERAALLERINLLSRHSNDIVLVTDERQVLVEVNDRACQQLGFARDELVGHPARELRDPATLGDFDARAAEELARGEAVYETRLRRRDGSSFPVEVSSRVADLGARRFVHAVVRDVTERRQLELQVHLADRMASVGTLAAGVAHEINNPLAFVLANLDFALVELERPGGDGAEVGRALKEARDGAVRIREIVRDLKSFSRTGEADERPVDVRKVLQTAVGLAQHEIRHRARLAMELDEVPAVLGSEHRLGQVFLNLLVNAAQSIRPGAADRNLVQARVATAEDGRVVAEITDSGGGIPEPLLPRIFDPFFTTKPVGGGAGAGLGLSICHGIVSAMGGEIRVRSEVGQGSTFTVLLPPARAEAPRPPAPAPADLGPAPPGRVLVVDDEPLVGRAVMRVLSPPHQVTVAANGAEALQALEAGRYDAILCDLMMPVMSGMELHARLAASDPAAAARMIFLTGGAFTDQAREFLERVPNARVEKPFEPVALREAVAATIRDAGPAR